MITRIVGDVPGRTMLDKARYLEEYADDLRKLIVHEPRAYPWTYCNLVLPSSKPAGDYGYATTEHVEYPSRSGTNTICVATVLIETGMVNLSEPLTTLTLEAPAGLIEIRAAADNGNFDHVPQRPSLRCAPR